MLALLSACVATARGATVDAVNVTYRAPGASAVQRNVSAALSDVVTVRDYGAAGSCVCARLRPPQPLTTACCPKDDTTSFMAAIAASSAVVVPPGDYRIDGTVEIPGSVELRLESGATLMRTNLTNATSPVVVLSGWYGALVGNGHVTTVNPSPNGVVLIGPATETRLYNTEWNKVVGVVVRGPGVSWSSEHPDQPVNAALNGSVGVCINSTAATVGGATYQNTVRDVTVQAVDVGVFLGVQVNANQVSGVMMEGIGQVGYLLVGPNSENVISGGFVAGHGGNTTVIKTESTLNPKTNASEGTWHNWFSGVLCEPGPGSRYFEFDEFSTANTLIGHDNTYHGGTTHDPSFTYLSGGALRLGNFSTAESKKHMPPDGPWKPPAGEVAVLQVEGLGYVKSLEHGLPSRRVGLADRTVEAVDDEPVIVSASAARGEVLSRVVVAGLRAARSAAAGGAGGGGGGGGGGSGWRAAPTACYYEITVSGVCQPHDGRSEGVETRVYSGRYIATPFQLPSGASRVAVTPLAAPGAAGNADLGDGLVHVVPVAFVDARTDSVSVAIEGGPAADCEVVVDTRRAGRGCAAPTVRGEPTAA